MSNNVADEEDVTVPSRFNAPRSAIAALTSVAFAAALSGCRYSVDLEPLEESAQSSQIIAAGGEVLARLDAGEDRTPVPIEQIAPVLRDAVVAIEDHRFFEHTGVDAKAIARALKEDLESGEIAQGGSTITQQYVRMILLGREQTISRKLREAVLALQLERRLDKEEILDRYLNTVYLGNGAYGVEAAADRYFAKHAADVSLAEAALLAALIQAPERYNPFVAGDIALERRDLVLSKMTEYGFAERSETDAARAEPIALSDDHWQSDYPAGHFVEQVKQFVLDDRAFGETRDERRRLLFQGGLRIETTIDMRLQMLAEDAVAKVLVDPANDPAASLVAVDPGTGRVVAYVGGRDFFGDSASAKFDLASQARRQAGSAFKPFVLAAAIEAGIPLDRTYDAPAEIEIPIPGQEPWTVHNYDGEGSGEMSLVDATVSSVNTVYAQLVMDVGAQAVIDLAARLGVESELDPYPSAALGTNGVNTLDLASAYASFAADGLHSEPAFVTRVVAPDGTILYEHAPSRERVLPAETARQVNAVLEQVVTRGTGVNARIGRPVAGKTGTGEEWRDAWFVGSTPELTAAVWVGFPDAERSMVPPVTRARVTGGLWPAQIWALFAAGALAETPAGEFPAPSESEGVAAKPVPLIDTVGMPGERATDLLSDAGYVVLTEERGSDDFPPGTVLAQRPGAYSPVTPATTVTLVVAREPRTLTVPLLLGMTAEDAQTTAHFSGFDIRVVVEGEPPPGSPDREGRVWRQSLVSGTQVEEGSEMTVWSNP